MIKAIFRKDHLRRIYRALTRVGVVTNREAHKLPRRASQQFTLNLIEAISNQKYSGSWAPLSKRYAKWKMENGLSPKVWEATGDLINAIKSKPVNSNRGDTRKGRKGFTYFAGISSDVIDTGGKNWSRTGPRNRIAWYAKMLEYGRGPSGGKFGGPEPSRPLFRPEFELFRGRTFMGYLLQSKREIWRAWV